MNYLDKSGFGSILLFLPAVLLICAFIYFKKKQQTEDKENNKFGRRGRKDHIWQILKEYLKKTNQIGVSIESSFIFERPNAVDMHDYLVRGLTFIEKEVAKQQNTKYKKHKFPKVLEEEEYFNNLAEETKNIRDQGAIKSHKVEAIRESVEKKKVKRKRYVILYKTKQKEIISPWLGIEVELIKQNTKDGKSKDTVVINKQLDVDMEMKWIAPLLREKINEKEKQDIKEKKKRESKNKEPVTKKIGKKLTLSTKSADK